MTILFDIPHGLAASIGQRRHDIATASSRLVVQQTRHPDHSYLAGLPALLVYRLPDDIAEADGLPPPILDRADLLKVLSEDSAEASTLAALREAVADMYADDDGAADFSRWGESYRRACAACDFEVEEADFATAQ